MNASPFQAQDETSPDKNANLHRTTARFTPLTLIPESFVVTCPLALVNCASDLVSIRQPAASLHASFPRSVALPQLRFTLIDGDISHEDSHLEVGAHAGRTRKGDTGIRCLLCWSAGGQCTLLRAFTFACAVVRFVSLQLDLWEGARRHFPTPP